MVDASRLKSPYFILKSCMSSSWIFCHDRSVLLSVVAYTLLVYIYCVKVRIFPLPVMPMRAASGKSRPIRAGFRTGTHHRLEWPRKASPSRARWMFLRESDNASTNQMFYPLKYLLGFNLL
jgi:hypothetical protein